MAGSESKKEEFQKYLEKSGVIDALTKGMISYMTMLRTNNKLVATDHGCVVVSSYILQYWLVYTKYPISHQMLLSRPCYFVCLCPIPIMHDSFVNSFIKEYLGAAVGADTGSIPCHIHLLYLCWCGCDKVTDGV
jgi:hypothetical protein